jgi:hypothetical protein
MSCDSSNGLSARPKHNLARASSSPVPVTYRVGSNCVGHMSAHLLQVKFSGLFRIGAGSEAVRWLMDTLGLCLDFTFFLLEGLFPCLTTPRERSGGSNPVGRLPLARPTTEPPAQISQSEGATCFPASHARLRFRVLIDPDHWLRRLAAVTLALFRP